MKKVHFHIGTGYTGAQHDEVMEFDDSATDEDIEEAYQDWKENKLDCQWWDEE